MSRRSCSTLGPPQIPKRAVDKSPLIATLQHSTERAGRLSYRQSANQLSTSTCLSSRALPGCPSFGGQRIGRRVRPAGFAFLQQSRSMCARCRPCGPRTVLARREAPREVVHIHARRWLARGRVSLSVRRRRRSYSLGTLGVTKQPVHRSGLHVVLSA